MDAGDFESGCDGDVSVENTTDRKFMATAESPLSLQKQAKTA